MQKALVAGIATAVVCSFMGTFLVLRRYSLGDGISHVAFGGISLGLFVGVFPIWTAFLVSILGGLGLQKLRSSARIPGDAAVVVVLTSGLAVGVILTSLSGGFSFSSWKNVYSCMQLWWHTLHQVGTFCSGPCIEFVLGFHVHISSYWLV